MGAFGELVLAVVNFLVHPAWHLVLVYIIALLIVAYSLYKSMFG